MVSYNVISRLPLKEWFEDGERGEGGERVEDIPSRRDSVSKA